MKKFILVTGIILSCALANAQPPSTENPDTARADAEITNATIYFGYGAELTHTAKVKANSTTKIIIINQVSTNIDANSLQINCPEDVTILSQQYNLFYPTIPVVVKSKEAEKLEDSIKLINKEISRIQNNILIEEETLTKTGTLIEATVTTSGNKTVTSAEVLKLLEFYLARIEKAKTNVFNYEQNIAQANERIDVLKKKIILLTNITIVRPKPYGQLILQVICKNSGEIPVALSYYTNNAGWTPMYDIRVNSKTNKVKLVYKASLTQTTGIDWKKTKLTLSTGTPNFGIAAPVLSPWYLQLYVPELYSALRGRVAGLNVNTRNRIQSFGDDNELKEMIVADSAGYKRRDMTGSLTTIDPSTLQDFTTLNQGQLNTNFEIDLPYDIESDGKLHSVSIKEQEIDCILKNYAVPRVDKEAYLLAEVADWQNLDLLPGDANIIMDNTYIGKSMIDPNSTADTMNLSLGKDKRLAIKRSLVKELSSLKPSGGSNKQTFTYEITVKNNKLTDVNLLLKDQYPLSTIKEVEVKLEDNGDAMVNEEAGVVTWKIVLKPGESKKVRFTYSVKYPKDKKIMNLK
jgi:uncharacterized protein (TIGR02231 family)